MDVHVRRTFRNEITISENAAVRATYFHSYLLEQTCEVFDIGPLECTTLETFSKNNLDARKSILSMHFIDSESSDPQGTFLLVGGSESLMMKDSASIISFHIQGNGKIDRVLGGQCFDDLVKIGLLLTDYFVLTSTLRPVICFAKSLPENTIHFEAIGEKLRPFGVDMTDYMNFSKQLGIQHTHGFNKD